MKFSSNSGNERRGLGKWRRGVMSLLMSAFLISGIAAPTPSFAYTDVAVSWWARWTEEAREWLEFLAALGNIVTAINKWIEVTTGFNTLETVRNVTKSAETTVDTYLAEQEVEGDSARKAAKTQADVAGEHQGSIAEDRLCNSIITSQGIDAMAVFRNSVLDLANAIYSREEDPKTSVGNGLAYAVQQHNIKCYGLPKTGGESYPAVCSPINSLSESEKDKMSEEDLLKVRSLVNAEGKWLADPLMALEMPVPVDRTINGETKKVIIADAYSSDPEVNPNWYEQQMWVAAWNFCFSAAGPRPTPPGKKDLSPDSIRARAQYDTCKSRESAMVSQCMTMVANMTRPQCDTTDGDVMTVCTNSMLSCMAARNLGAELPSGYGSCKRGLTMYQTMALNYYMCLAGDWATLSASDGSEPGRTFYEVNDCAKMKADFDNKVADDRMAFDTAIAALSRMGECWAQVYKK